MERSFLAYRAHVTAPIRIMAEHAARKWECFVLVPQSPLNQLEVVHFFPLGRVFTFLGVWAKITLLLEIYELQVSAEAVRRWLHREQLVWRRPRPIVGPTDPERDAKLHALRQLLVSLPPNEIAVFQDEVDINPTPKSGPCGCAGAAKL